MVNAEPRAPYRRAVLGTDLSRHSLEALRFARESGMMRGAQLAVAHAFEAVGKGKLAYAGVGPAAVAAHVALVESDARAALEAFLAANPLEPRPFEARVGEGRPAEVLAAVARALDADLVIVGTHGASAAARLLLGSVTEALMRDLDRDVLAVPPSRP
jgi:nucleotide-binding universal stress UspA family protein